MTAYVPFHEASLPTRGGPYCSTTGTSSVVHSRARLRSTQRRVGGRIRALCHMGLGNVVICNIRLTTPHPTVKSHHAPQNSTRFDHGVTATPLFDGDRHVVYVSPYLNLYKTAASGHFQHNCRRATRHDPLSFLAFSIVLSKNHSDARRLELPLQVNHESKGTAKGSWCVAPPTTIGWTAHFPFHNSAPQNLFARHIYKTKTRIHFRFPRYN